MRPVAGLLIDWDAGEGAVKLSDRFQSENALFKADVLKDWCEDLLIEYARVTGVELPEMLKQMQIDLVEKIVDGQGK